MQPRYKNRDAFFLKKIFRKCEKIDFFLKILFKKSSRPYSLAVWLRLLYGTNQYDCNWYGERKQGASVAVASSNSEGKMAAAQFTIRLMKFPRICWQL